MKIKKPNHIQIAPSHDAVRRGPLESDWCRALFIAYYQTVSAIENKPASSHGEKTGGPLAIIVNSSWI